MKILSISDVITNSSSEVFCYITGEKTTLEEVYKTLDRIFGYDQECEVTPVVAMSDKQITVDIPYHMGKGAYEYFRGGIESLINDVEDFQNCKIEFV